MRRRRCAIRNPDECSYSRSIMVEGREGRLDSRYVKYGQITIIFLTSVRIVKQLCLVNVASSQKDLFVHGTVYVCARRATSLKQNWECVGRGQRCRAMAPT